MKVNVRLLATVTLVALIFPLILAACTPDAGEFILSPSLSQQIAARDAGEVITVIREELKTLADLTPDEIYAGLPPEILSEIANVDPAAGDAVHVKYACAGCHSLDGSVKAGPTWQNLGNIAVNRVNGESPAFYLYQSIIEPSVYIVPGYPDGIMPKTFKDQMSPTEIAEVVRFILEQTE